MTHKKSILAELFERRVPQILGMYVAAVWLAVEIGDWMSERFDVPAQFSSYVFVTMIALLPMVGMLAWAFGRPGKDKLNTKQLVFIPFNLVIAMMAVYAFIKPPVQATETMSLVDEHTGQVVDYEVPKTGLSQKVLGFFWENQTGDQSLDWLSYGAMWLVSQDMMRHPVISIQTPYQSDQAMNTIQNQGYENAIGEPLSLDISIASDKDAQWLIRGRIYNTNNEVTFEASLYDVISGALVTTVSSTYDDWLFALDDVAKQLTGIILKKAHIETNLIPDLVISEHVSKNLSAIQSVINSLNAVSFDNDYQQGIEHLKTALDADDSLAEAYVLLIEYYVSIGDFPAAQAASEAALNLDYKLYQESVFKVKANYYAVKGEQDKAVKVLENWTRVHPDSADAWRILGGNLIQVGHRLDDALHAFEQLEQLQEAGSTSLISRARIYRLKGDMDKAIALLQVYQQQQPDDVKPHLEMADAYMQFGLLDEARRHYDEASLLGINEIKADLGLAKIIAYQGDVAASLQAIDQLVRKADTNEEKVMVLTEKETLLFLTGQLRAAMDLLDEMREYSRSFMNPLAQMMMFGSKEVAYLAYLGDFEQAWQLFENMKSGTKPPFDELLNMMASTIHELQGNFQLAGEAIEKFEVFKNEFEMSVYDQFIYVGKATKYKNMGDYEKALEFHDLAISETKQSFITLNSFSVIDDFQYRKADTLHASGRHQEAIDLLAVVLKRNPLYAQCLVLKAKALRALGDEQAAMASLQQASSVWEQADPDFKDLVALEELKQQWSVE